MKTLYTPIGGLIAIVVIGILLGLAIIGFILGMISYLSLNLKWTLLGASILAAIVAFYIFVKR